jgi:hypothetical protein
VACGREYCEAPLFLRDEGSQLSGEVVDVGLIGRGIEDFVDDREEVVEGADRVEPALLRTADGPAGGSEDEGGPHDAQRDVAVVEIGSESSVATTGT